MLEATQSQGGHRMKLHANAALSLNRRERMVVAGGRAGLVADEGRRGGRSQRPHLRASGWRATGPRASWGCWIAPRRRRWSPTAPTSDASQAIAALRRLRFTGPEIAELLDMAALDGLGDPDADRDGQARPAGPGARRALRARAAGRADPHRRQEARPHPGRRRQARHRRQRATPARRATTPRASTARSSAGTTCTSPSTTPPAWPTPRSSPTRRPPPRSASCAARSRSTRATASPSSA